MRAIVKRDGGAALADVAEPRPQEGEVLVDVAFAGVCRSDLAAADGALAVADGRVLGHELSGHMNGVPVTVVPFAPCGRCGGCTGQGRCERWRWLGVDRDGAFAARVAVPLISVLRLPRELSLLVGAYVEPVAAALGVVPLVERGMRVCIGGTGRIAELSARIVAAIGAVRADARCDVAIEHDGDPAALIPALRSGGTLVLKSRAARSIALPAGELVARELTVRGISHGDFREAIAWLAERRIVVDDLLAPPRPLADHAAVFAAARSESHKHLFAIGDR